MHGDAGAADGEQPIGGERRRARAAIDAVSTRAVAAGAQSSVAAPQTVAATPLLLGRFLLPQTRVRASAYHMIVAAAPHLPRLPTEHERMLVARYLGDRFTAAQRAFPGVVVAPEVFWPYVAARLSARQTLDALDEVHFHDLYLACACQAGDRRALELIDRRHLPAAFAGIEKVGLGEARVAGLKLELRRQLFLVEGGRTPKITAYWGRGSLVRWLRTLVQRAAIEILQQDRLAVRRVHRR